MAVMPWPFASKRRKIPGVATNRIAAMNSSSKMDHKAVLRVELEVLKCEHRDLDDAIHALQESRRADQLSLKRLKKKKLALKDRISAIEDELLPDIIA